MLSFTKRHIFILCHAEQWVYLWLNDLCFLAAWGDCTAHGSPGGAGGSGPMPPEKWCPCRCQSQGRCWCLRFSSVTCMSSIFKRCRYSSSLDVEMPRTVSENINSVTVFQAKVKWYGKYTQWKMHFNFRNISVWKNNTI